MNAQQILLAGPYNLFYACAFVTAFGVAHWRGTAAGVPARRLVFFLVFCAIAGVLGSRFLPFDLSAVELGEKTVLGGLLAVCTAALAARIVLGLDARYTDSLAIALPAGFAIGRVGCFLAGCCAGSPTDLPWGIHYPGAAEAVHPTQLYEAAGGVLLALAAQYQLRRRRDILIPGVVLPYLVLRFGLQFLREQNGGAFGTTHVLLILCGGFLLLAHVIARRCRQTSAGESSWLWAAGAAACMVLTAARALTPLEAVTLTSLALVGGALIVARMSRPALRALPAFASVIALQQADTTASRRYLTVGGGAARGQYVETCGPAHRYAMGGASVAYTSVPRPTQEWSVKAQVFAGSDRERPRPIVAGLMVDSVVTLPWADTTVSVVGGAVVLSGRTGWLGGTIGLVGGNLLHEGERRLVSPVLGVRVGPPAFFFEGSNADLEPVPVPLANLQLGIGTRFTAQGSELRAGVSEQGFYGRVLLVARGWEIEPRLTVGDGDNRQLGITVRKRFELRPAGR